MSSLPSVAGVGSPDGIKKVALLSDMSITISGTLNEFGVEHFKALFAACRCDTYWTYHSKDCQSFPGMKMIESKSRRAAARYMEEVGLKPTPDAVDQMTLVFEKCLRIMCERPWHPNGNTWRKSGFFGILHDIRKKFERLWERSWGYGKFHEDSAIDLINYIGFLCRSDEKNRWGEWGEPAGKADS